MYCPSSKNLALPKGKPPLNFWNSASKVIFHFQPPPSQFSFSQAVVLFSHLANMISMANVPSTNDTKNKGFFLILLAANIAHSKDNEIDKKHLQD